jgi:tripartite-type tricarboxylate transporter receptor subunit TctC
LAAAGTAVLAGCGRRPAVAGCPGLAGKRVRWIVPYSPGGGYDVFSRLLEGPYEHATGAEIVIDNVPGGGGLLGATQLRHAPPDGRTLGILNAPGLMTAALSASQPYPSPARDYDVIGRLQRNVQVLFTGAASGLRDMNDVFARQRERPMVVGLTGIVSGNVAAFAVIESLLGLHLRYVAGYPGSREEILGVLRGEVDLVSSTYESIRDQVDAGDLRVLLQISDGRIADDPALDGVGWLGGEEGWAVRRLTAGGRTREQARHDAHALTSLLGAGTIVAAPRGLPSDRLTCLRAAFVTATAAPAFRQAATAARRTLDIAGGEEARAVLTAAEDQLARFAPLTRAVIERIP